MREDAWESCDGKRDDAQPRPAMTCSLKPAVTTVLIYRGVTLRIGKIKQQLASSSKQWFGRDMNSLSFQARKHSKIDLLSLPLESRAEMTSLLLPLLARLLIVVMIASIRKNFKKSTF